MEELYNKKYVVAVKHNGKDVFYNCIDGEDGVFVGIRSNAHKFDSEFDAMSLKSLLKASGYDACVEPFYVFGEKIKTD